MKLRDHPKLAYLGVHSWPPAWVWRGGNKYSEPVGEVGVLNDVKLSNIEPCESCFLIIAHEGQEYAGALLFEDPLLCREIYKVLFQRRGESIESIGDIDLSDTPSAHHA
jgi:hypothetical protein